MRQEGHRLWSFWLKFPESCVRPRSSHTDITLWITTRSSLSTSERRHVTAEETPLHHTILSLRERESLGLHDRKERESNWTYTNETDRWSISWLMRSPDHLTWSSCWTPASWLVNRQMIMWLLTALYFDVDHVTSPVLTFMLDASVSSLVRWLELSCSSCLRFEFSIFRTSTCLNSWSYEAAAMLEKPRLTCRGRGEGLIV